ncbi:pilus assembly protein TadG-related protein [Microvirga sp. GCM10011540]|uniref:pilus assembly protein TadG-related protein n=1 Tax=Microvirga sp. GCM10011540 TaxID=3317338 RepID=UPI00360C81FC
MLGRRYFTHFPAVASALRALRASILGFVQDRSGNVAVTAALALPILLGGSGLGLEISYWYATQRLMQNAADSAAVAAATNAGSTYISEANAVASTYGFINGSNNVVVTAVDNALCPSGKSECYNVTITQSVPLFLSQLVGYSGTVSVKTTIGGETITSRQTALSASAIAIRTTSPRKYCVLALGSSGVEHGIRTNGAPKSSLSGCGVMSNTAARCTGQGLDADYGDAAGSNDGCGEEQRSSVPPVTDPYASLSSQIGLDPCGGTYPQMPDNKGDPALPATNLWQGEKSFGATQVVCGDLQLTGDLAITSPAEGTALVIWNGRLNTNGFKLTGSALTIIFAGSSTGPYIHGPVGGGTLDITAPTSGPWKGVALYQAPNLTTGVDISDAGNSPTWNITGLVYLPHANVTFSGAVNKSSTGNSCFALVVANIRVNGTGAILSRGSECPAAGLDLPAGPGRGQLIG